MMIENTAVIALLLASTASEPVAATRAELTARGFDSGDVARMRVVRDYPTPGTGMRTVWLQQTADSLPVVGAITRFAVGTGGDVIWWDGGTKLVPGGVVARGARDFDAVQAVERAAAAVSVELGGDPTAVTALADQRLRFAAPNLAQPALSEPVVLPSGAPGWVVVLDQLQPADVWRVVVDASTGRVVAREHLTFALQTGLVYDGQFPDTAPFPGGVPQTVESFGPTAESPNGYLLAAPAVDFQHTTGNNAIAREDWAGDNEVTLGGWPDGGVAQDFDFVFTNNWEVSAIYDIDTNAAITNAFYWANRWHDEMYALGFDEPAGNFQVDNFGRGGIGGDPMRVDVQDAALLGAINNANFGTPVDGMMPRLQLYLWNIGGVRRDSAFDADVMLHEMTHGLSTRLVGGPDVGCLGTAESGALAEGVSDHVPAALFEDPVLAEYVTNDPTGGLRGRLDLNPNTYCDRCAMGCQVILDGGILATALWYLGDRLGHPVALQLVVDALKLVPCRPTFLDLRDGILTADDVRYAGANKCVIWDVFRSRGMGWQAMAGGGPTGCDLDFVPPECSLEPYLDVTAHTWSDVAGGNGDGLIRAGETIDLNIDLTNLSTVSTATVVSVVVTPLTPGVTMLDGTRMYVDIAPLAVESNPLPFRFQLDADYPCGAPLVFAVDLAWSTPMRTRRETITLTGFSVDGARVLTEGFEAASSIWTLTGTAGMSNAENHTPAGSQSVYMSSACYTGPTTGCGLGCDNTCASVTSSAIALPADRSMELRFWTRYNLEYLFDALYVEVSDDGGATWSAVAIAGGETFNGGTSGCAPDGQQVGLTGPVGNPMLTPWTEGRVNLAAWAGREVQLRIRQHNDACAGFEGAYVDDIELVAQACQAGSFVAMHTLTSELVDDIDPMCTDSDGRPDPGETVRLTTTVANLGNTIAPMAEATLLTASSAVLGLPQTNPLGDIAGGATVTTSFDFTIADASQVGCHETADLELEVASQLPSSDITDLPLILRSGDATIWYDDIDGLQPPWIPSLGPDGSQQDFALRSIDCSANGLFWSTNVMMIDPGNCGSGEPDYSPDSDSVLTSPAIDLGAPGARLLTLRWRAAPSAYIGNWGGTVDDGFVEVSIDHDGGGGYTTLARWDRGLNSIDQFQEIDIQNNPAASPILAADTVRYVHIRFRLRALAPDPSVGRGDDGLLVDEVQLIYEPCSAGMCGCTAPADPLGNVLRAVEDGADVVFSWAESAMAESYEVARSEARDFALPRTTVGTALPGSPTVTDLGAVPGPPDLYYYRVAQTVCGTLSPW